MKKIVLILISSLVAAFPLIGFAETGGWLAGAGNGNVSDGEKYNECMKANDDSNYCACVAAGGVQLNTDVPFVGKCINKTDTDSAFPQLVGGLSKMVVTAILIVSFVMIIVGGVMRTTGNASEGKKLITKVAIGLAILGASGAILRLINPNFFT